MVTIFSMGFWEQNNWKWRLDWPASMQQTEAVEAEALAVLLADVKPVQARADRRKWVPESSGQFTVRSTYSFLQNMDVTNVIDTDVVCALKKLWLNDVPSKV
ncbi:hypothetical protein L195_g059280, partial [Trifolium pratense]